jgi:hypothetical protein
MYVCGRPVRVHTVTNELTDDFELIQHQMSYFI